MVQINSKAKKSSYQGGEILINFYVIMKRMSHVNWKMATTVDNISSGSENDRKEWLLHDGSQDTVVYKLRNKTNALTEDTPGPYCFFNMPKKCK
jgi:hypothetical protein